LSPKGVSTKQLPQDIASPKNYRQASIADAGKSSKKIRIVDEPKMEGTHKQSESKFYAQNLEKSKQE
jgi:hypothetical protein